MAHLRHAYASADSKQSINISRRNKNKEWRKKQCFRVFKKRMILIASEGDLEVLSCFEQGSSSIYNSGGEHLQFIK